MPSTTTEDWAQGNAAGGIKVRFSFREELSQGAD